MASAPPPAAPSRLPFKEILAMIGTIAATAAIVAGIVHDDGKREQRLQQFETRLSQLEQREDRRADLLNAIDVRTARIEATLQMMTKAAGR